MEEPVEPRDVPAGAKELGVVVDETVRVLSHAFEQLDSLVAAQEAMVCPNVLTELSGLPCQRICSVYRLRIVAASGTAGLMP